jgi:hypothetical protein
MFRIGAAFVAFGILAAGVAPIVPASPALADPNPGIALCRNVLLPGRPASNLGECLSYINVAENQSKGEPAHACDFLEENDPFVFELLFVSRSECIQAFGSRGQFK